MRSKLKSILDAMVRTLLVRKAAVLLTAVIGLSPIAKAATSESINVMIGIQDVYAPSAVTDLRGSAGGVGQMLLQWTAPEQDNFVFTNRDAASSYTIKIATFSVDSLGSTTTWWNNAQDVSGEPAPSTPGLTDSLLLNGLTQDVTYYAAIKSMDAVGNESLIDVRAGIAGLQAAAFISSLNPPSSPNNFAGSPQGVSSITWTWDASPTASFYTVNEYPSQAQVGQTSALFLTETGLNVNTAYSRTVRAANGNGLSNASAAVSVYTLAAVPSSPTFDEVLFTTITVSWSAGGNPAGTQYRIERSVDGTSFVSLAVGSIFNYTDTGLSELSTYYYRVRAFNGDGVITSPSVVISTVTPQQADFTKPAAPLGFKGTVDASGNAFTLTWEAVTRNHDGTATSDVVGYNIYRRSTINGTPTQVNSSVVTVTAFADQINGVTYYYTVRAIDSSGNESDEDLMVDSSADTNLIFLAEDGLSTIVIPQSINDLLRSAFNKYGVPLTIRLEERALTTESGIVRTVRYKILRADNGEEVTDLSFDKPEATIGLGYSLQDGNVLIGSPLGQGFGSAATSTNATPDKLSLYWNNGVTWVKVGGTVDESAQSVKTRSAFLGDFQLRVSASATSLDLQKANVFPRVFTPNADGHNDRVYFVLENPNNATVVGEIFDLSGRKVADLPDSSNTAGVGTTLVWDGKDMNGDVVPSGAYYYRIKGEGKTFTGTVAVAR